MYSVSILEVLTNHVTRPKFFLPCVCFGLVVFLGFRSIFGRGGVTSFKWHLLPMHMYVHEIFVLEFWAVITD